MALWGSRWRKSLNKDVEEFTYSLDFDKRLFKVDLIGTLAHVLMLNKIGVITNWEIKVLVEEIKKLYELLKEDIDNIKDSEDIHTYIEENLTKKIGDIAKKIHTGRSRNDQVALDLRLYLREEAYELSQLILKIRENFLSMAERYIDSPMPGYTHLQEAQPVSIGHYFLAYDSMFERDLERLWEIYKRLDVMPLGSGALAGSNLPLDRYYVAEILGFSEVSDNSMDSVADRDFVADFIYFSSLIFTHLSKLSEEIILWSTQEFSFIRLPEEYSTGSSMMPHKRNPDVAELTRGKTGKIIGNLVNILTILKALPLSYNRDLQEDKPAVFLVIDELKLALKVWSNFILNLEFNMDKIEKTLRNDFLYATDIAEYLVLRGMPFRDAHKMVGEVVKYCEDNSKGFKELSIEEWKNFSPLFDEEIFKLLNPEESIKSKKTWGSPNPSLNREVIKKKRQSLRDQKLKWELIKDKLPSIDKIIERVNL
jgi:argininosuccinate lyase